MKGFVFVQSESNTELHFSKIIALLIEGYSTSVQKYDTNVQVYKVSCFLSMQSTTVTTESKFQKLLRLLYYCSGKWIHLMKKDQLT